MKYAVSILEEHNKEITIEIVESNTSDVLIIVEKAVLQYENEMNNGDIDPMLKSWLNQNVLNSKTFHDLKEILLEHNSRFPKYFISKPLLID